MEENCREPSASMAEIKLTKFKTAHVYLWRIRFDVWQN